MALATSATGGFLLPAASPAPKEGQTLNRFLNEIMVGLTGLPGKMVRPRWQREPANIPEIDENWLAFGVMRRIPDTYAVELHYSESSLDPPGAGNDELQRHETFEMLLSFYGPDADSNLEIFREGLQIAQNREVFQNNAMGLVETGEALTIPSLVKEQWYYRVDMTMTMRRQIRRNYPVFNLLSFVGGLEANNEGTDVFDININTGA